MKPPVFPFAPNNYDAEYINRFLRILTQYLNQESVDEAIVEQEADVNEVMQWLT